MEKKEYLGVQAISNRIAEKYKISRKSIRIITQLLIDEIREVVLKEGKEVVIPKLFSMKLSAIDKYGMDFKTGKRFENQRAYKIEVNPTRTLTEEVREMSKTLNETI